jgi:hypothetical protein
MNSHGALWDWTRYWLPHSSISETLVSGLLSSTPSGMYQTIEQLSDRRLLVLLGEPGSGKSVEIRQEHARISNQLGPGGRVIYLDGRTTVQSQRTLDRIWFDSDVWRNWQASSDDIWIFFDGFDESAQHIRGLGGIIHHELHQVLAGDDRRARRLFLRIASRTTGWQPELGAALYQFLYPGETEEWSPEHFTFHLAPPRWEDVAVAAESRAINGKDFCERIREQGIESLTLRPAQLEWLLNVFERGGRLPDDKEQLYWEGIRQLCQDPLQDIEAELPRALAGRVAFVTMFGGLRSLWFELDRGDVPPNSIPLSRFVGGVEQTSRGDNFPVTQELLGALVRSGLFTSAESAQAVWSHQTYPEYLAAKYLVTRDLPLSQMAGLITNPLDPAQKVLPGMLEVAAWIASMNEDVFEHLLHHDPASLIERDVALTNPEDRERLVRAFLSALASGQVLRTRWPQKGHYASLCFPGIADVLTPFITDKALRKDPRDTAIDIAVDCGLEELGDVLAAVALDATDLEVVRRSAAWAVTRIGSEHARQRLKPLVAAPADEDPLEELKGCALRANWPDNLTIQQVLEHLTAPKWYSLGAYRLFLSEHFVQNLSNGDLLPALAWLDEQRDWGERSHDLNELEAQLVHRAMEQFDELAVCNWITRRVAANLTEYKPLFGEGVRGDVSADLLASAERRRELIEGMARIVTDAEKLDTIAYMVGEYFRRQPAWVESDYPWMAQQLQESEAGSITERFWLQLLRETVSITNEKQISLLHQLYSNDRFRRQLADLFEPVDFRSAEAARLRQSWYARANKLDRNPRDPEPRVDIQHHIEAILDCIDNGRPSEWWRIDQWLHFNESGNLYGGPVVTDSTELPGWQLCSPAVQARIIETALEFLQGYEPNHSYVGTNRYYLADHAAYRALSLLLAERPHELGSLPAAAWRKLGPILLGMYPQSTSEEIPHQRTLLKMAMGHGFDPAPWLIVIASRADDSSSFYFSPALRSMVSVATDKQLDELATALIHPETPRSALIESVRVLCDRGLKSALGRSLEVIEQLIEEPEDVETAADVVDVLMHFVDRPLWEELRALFESNDALFDRALLSYTHWQSDAAEFARALDETAIANLYEKLALRFPPAEDPNIGELHVVSFRESLGRWREDLLTSLAMRGTWAAVEQLRDLAQRLPHIGWLPILIATDIGRGLLISWIPFAYWFGVLTMTQLYTVTFLIGTLTVLFETAYQSFLPSIVERSRLVDASGKLGVTESITNVAGPSIAGAVIQVLNSTVGVLVNAVAYLASAFFLLRIEDHESDIDRSSVGKPMEALREGFAYLWRHKQLRAFALSNAMFMLFFMVVQAVIFIFFTDTLDLEAAPIGVRSMCK